MYLLYEKFNTDMDIDIQRSRILSNLRNILISDNAIYQPLDTFGIFISIPSKNALYQRRNRTKKIETQKIIRDLRTPEQVAKDRAVNSQGRKNLRDMRTPGQVVQDKQTDVRRKSIARKDKKEQLPPKYKAAQYHDDISEYHFKSLKFDVKCMHCKAEHWSEELTIENTRKNYHSFDKCCNHGKIELEKLRSIPPVLKELLMSTHRLSGHFFEHIRRLNSAVSFASMNSMEYKFEGSNRGAYCFRIHGQITHLINTALLPDDGQKHSFGQLFFIFAVSRRYDDGNAIRKARFVCYNDYKSKVGRDRSKFTPKRKGSAQTRIGGPSIS
jgi:hypothetical protein